MSRLKNYLRQEDMCNFALLGRRQAASHLVLIQAFVGSNPAAPAIFNLKNPIAFFRYID